MPPPPRPEPVLCVFYVFLLFGGKVRSACTCMRVYAHARACAAKCMRLLESRACDCMSESSNPRPDPVFCVFNFIFLAHALA
jgi:hypothetical protein